MWGKLPGYDWWPGVVLSYSDSTNGTKKDADELSDDEMESNSIVRVWVKWYGDNQLSQVCTRMLNMSSPPGSPPSL